MTGLTPAQQTNLDTLLTNPQTTLEQLQDAQTLLTDKFNAYLTQDSSDEMIINLFISYADRLNAAIRQASLSSAGASSASGSASLAASSASSSSVGSVPLHRNPEYQTYLNEYEKIVDEVRRQNLSKEGRDKLTAIILALAKVNLTLVKQHLDTTISNLLEDIHEFNEQRAARFETLLNALLEEQANLNQPQHASVSGKSSAAASAPSAPPAPSSKPTPAPTSAIVPPIPPFKPSAAAAFAPSAPPAPSSKPTPAPTSAIVPPIPPFNPASAAAAAAAPAAVFHRDIRPSNILLDPPSGAAPAVVNLLPSAPPRHVVRPINEVNLEQSTLAFARRRPQAAPRAHAANTEHQDILFIIDRSGSMYGQRIAAAKRMLQETKAHGNCRVRVVVFDHSCNQADIIHDWNGQDLRLGGTTDISGGLHEGFQYVNRLLDENGNDGLRVIFLSDGYANTVSPDFARKLGTWTGQQHPALPQGFAPLVDEFGNINPAQPPLDTRSAMTATEAIAIAIGNYFKAKGVSQRLLCHVVNMGGQGDTVNFTGLAAALGGNNGLLTTFTDAELRVIEQDHQSPAAQALLGRVLGEIIPLLEQRIAALPMNVRAFNAAELLENGRLGQETGLQEHLCAVIVPADGNFEARNADVEVLTVDRLLDLPADELITELEHILNSLNQFANRTQLNFSRYSNLARLQQEAPSQAYQRAILGRILNVIRFMERFEIDVNTRLAIWMSRQHPKLREHLEDSNFIYSEESSCWEPIEELELQLAQEGYSKNQQGEWVRARGRESQASRHRFLHERIYLLNEVNGHSRNPHYIKAIIGNDLPQEGLSNPLEQFLPLIKTVIANLRKTHQTYSRQFRLAADCDPVRFESLMQNHPVKVALNLASKREQARNRGIAQQLIDLLDPSNFLDYLKEALEEVQGLNPALLAFLNEEVNPLTQARFSDIWDELRERMDELADHPELSTDDERVSFLLELRAGASFNDMPLLDQLRRIMNFLPQQGRAVVLTQIGQGDETNSFHMHPLRQRHMVSWSTDAQGHVAVPEVARVLQVPDGLMQEELRALSGLSDEFINGTQETSQRLVCATLRPEELYSREAMRVLDPAKHFRKRTAARISSSAAFGQIDEPQARHNISYHHHTFHMLFTAFQRFAATGPVPDNAHLPDDDLLFFVATAIPAFSTEDSACRRLMEEMTTLPGEELYTVNLLGEYTREDTGLHADSNVPVRAILSYLTRLATSPHHQDQLTDNQLQQVFYSLMTRVVKHSNLNSEQTNLNDITPETASFAPYTDEANRTIDPATQLAYVAFCYFLIKDLRNNPFEQQHFELSRGSELDWCTHLRGAFLRVQTLLAIPQYAASPAADNRAERQRRAQHFNRRLMQAFAQELRFQSSAQLNDAVLTTLRQGAHTKVYPLFTSGDTFERLRVEANPQLEEPLAQEHQENLQHLYNLVSAGIAFPSIFEKLLATEAGTHAHQEVWLAELKEEIKRLSSTTPVHLVDVLPDEADCEMGAYYLVINGDARDLLYHNHKKKGLINIDLSVLSQLPYRGLSNLAPEERRKFVNAAFAQLHESIQPNTSLILPKIAKTKASARAQKTDPLKLITDPTRRRRVSEEIRKATLLAKYAKTGESSNAIVKRVMAQMGVMPAASGSELHNDPEFRHLLNSLRENPFAVFYRRLEADGSIAPIQMPDSVSVYAIVYNELSGEHHLRYYPISTHRDFSHWMDIPLSALPGLQAFAQDPKRAAKSWIGEIKADGEFLDANGPWPTDALTMNRFPPELVETFAAFHISDMRKLRESIWKRTSDEEVIELVHQLTLTTPFSLVNAPCDIRDISKHLQKAYTLYSIKRNEEELDEWLDLLRQALQHCQSDGRHQSDRLLRIAQDIIFRLERAPKDPQSWTSIAVANSLIALQRNPALQLAALDIVCAMDHPQQFRHHLPRVALIGITALPKKKQEAFLAKLEEMYGELLTHRGEYKVEVAYYLARFLGFQFNAIQPEDLESGQLTLDDLIADFADSSEEMPFGSTRTYSQSILTKLGNLFNKFGLSSLFRDELLPRLEAQEERDLALCQVIQDPTTTQLQALVRRVHSLHPSSHRLWDIKMLKRRQTLSLHMKKVLTQELEELNAEIPRLQEHPDTLATQIRKNELLEEKARLEQALQEVANQLNADRAPQLRPLYDVTTSYFTKYSKGTPGCADLCAQIDKLNEKKTTYTKPDPYYSRYYHYSSYYKDKTVPDTDHPGYKECEREIARLGNEVTAVYQRNHAVWQERVAPLQAEQRRLLQGQQECTRRLAEVNERLKPLEEFVHRREHVTAQLERFGKHIPNLQARINAHRQHIRGLSLDQQLQAVKTLLKTLGISHDQQATSIARVIETLSNPQTLVELDEQFQRRCAVHLFERNLSVKEIRERVARHLPQRERRESLEAAVIKQVLHTKFAQRLHPNYLAAILAHVDKLVAIYVEKNKSAFLIKKKQERLFNFNQTEANETTLNQFLKQILGLGFGSGQKLKTFMTELLSGKVEIDRAVLTKLQKVIAENEKAATEAAEPASTSAAKPAPVEVFDDRTALCIFEGDYASPTEEETDRVLRTHLPSWQPEDEALNFAVVREVFLSRFKEARIARAYENIILARLAETCSGPLTKSKWALLGEIQRAGASRENLQVHLTAFLTRIAGLNLGSPESREGLIGGLLSGRFDHATGERLKKAPFTPLPHAAEKPLVSRAQLALVNDILDETQFTRRENAALRQLIRHNLTITDEPLLSVTDLLGIDAEQQQRQERSRAAFIAQGFGLSAAAGSRTLKDDEEEVTEMSFR